MTKIEKGLTLLFLGTMITGMKMTPPIAKLSPPIANKIPKDVTIQEIHALIIIFGSGNGTRNRSWIT